MAGRRNATTPPSRRCRSDFQTNAQASSLPGMGRRSALHHLTEGTLFPVRPGTARPGWIADEHVGLYIIGAYLEEIPVMKILPSKNGRSLPRFNRRRMSGGLISSSRATYSENTATRTALPSMSHPCNLERMRAGCPSGSSGMSASRASARTGAGTTARETRPSRQAGSRKRPVSFVSSGKASQTWEITVSARNIGV